MREQRRYRAEMPAGAWLRGRAPKERRRKRDAHEDLAAGLSRYLAGLQGAGAPLPAGRLLLDDRPRGDGTLANWASWALRLGAGCARASRAPDGTSWSVTTRIDYI